MDFPFSVTRHVSYVTFLLFRTFTVYTSEATHTMMPENLQETIGSIRKGDRTAFKKLVEMYQQPAFRLAFRILGNEEEAKDTVQDSFIKIWQKIGSYDSSREFIPWMYRIVANTAADRLRSMRRHVMVPIDLVAEKRMTLQQRDQGTPADNHDLAVLITGLAGMLPEKQKMVFILRDVEGMSSEEVETITELTADAVKSNLYHARKSVRERLFKILEKERSIK